MFSATTRTTLKKKCTFDRYDGAGDGLQAGACSVHPHDSSGLISKTMRVLKDPHVFKVYVATEGLWR